MAHLHLGLLAYWVVNTVRFQLKSGQVKELAKIETEEQVCNNRDMPVKYNSQWKEIIRIMNTQKAVTTVSQNRHDEVIISHRCSDPTPKADAIYKRLNYKSKPNINRKFVVHKSEFQKMDVVDLYRFPT